MNNIMLVARGEKIDTSKIVSSLQSMILDSSKETVNCFYAKDMVFDYKDLFLNKHHEEDNTFMAQIVEKGKDMYPLHFSYRDDERQKTVEMVICGVFDEEQVKDSKMIEKHFEDESMRELMYGDLKNLPKHMCSASGYESIEYCFRGIDSTMFIYRLDFHDYEFFSNGTSGCFVGYKDDCVYYSNSREVLENIGIKCDSFQRYHTSYGGGTGYSLNKEESKKSVFKSGFDVLRENFEKEISVIKDPKIRKKMLAEYQKVVNYYKKLLKAPAKIKVYTNKNKNENK